jgi:hypothetical protein
LGITTSKLNGGKRSRKKNVKILNPDQKLTTDSDPNLPMISDPDPQYCT